jgi:hypothetical protein
MVKVTMVFFGVFGESDHGAAYSAKTPILSESAFY